MTILMLTVSDYQLRTIEGALLLDLDLVSDELDAIANVNYANTRTTDLLTTQQMRLRDALATVHGAMLLKSD